LLTDAMKKGKKIVTLGKGKVTMTPKKGHVCLSMRQSTQHVLRWYTKTNMWNMEDIQKSFGCDGATGKIMSWVSHIRKHGVVQHRCECLEEKPDPKW